MNSDITSNSTKDDARRMSRELSRVGRSISADRLEALFEGARPSETELESLRTLNQHDLAQIARLRSRLAWLDALRSRLWLAVIVSVTVALGLSSIPDVLVAGAGLALLVIVVVASNGRVLGRRRTLEAAERLLGAARPNFDRGWSTYEWDWAIKKVSTANAIERAKLGSVSDGQNLPDMRGDNQRSQNR